MDLYASNARYNALLVSEANHDELLTWGIDTSTFMVLDHLMVVRDVAQGMVVAIIDLDAFNSQYTLVAE